MTKNTASGYTGYNSLNAESSVLKRASLFWDSHKLQRFVFLGEPTGLKIVHFGDKGVRPARPGAKCLLKLFSLSLNNPPK